MNWITTLKDQLSNLSRSPAKVQKFKENAVMAKDVWKGFYSAADGDKIQKSLTATEKTYNMYKKMKGKNER